jgi:DNA-3-methyladenine glycosylase I
MSEESDCRKWALPDPLLTEYHDHEWCRISHDDRHIFEMLCLEGQSVGLSWRIIINKREAYRKVFRNFEIAACAELSDAYLDSLQEDPRLIRNKAKIYSIRGNAVVATKIVGRYGSLDSFIWSYTGGRQIVGRWRTSADIPTQTDVSRKMSRDLKSLGMSFVGPVITYSFMQSIGMVNDHLLDCAYR